MVLSMPWREYGEGARRINGTHHHIILWLCLNQLWDHSVGQAYLALDVT